MTNELLECVNRDSVAAPYVNTPELTSSDQLVRGRPSDGQPPGCLRDGKQQAVIGARAGSGIR